MYTVAPSPSTARRAALLMIGPTGSGKTPLGAYWERHGLWGLPCRHFDFGAQLRRVARHGGGRAGLTDGETARVREVLATGALLEPEDTPLALRVLEAYLRRHALPATGWLVLNGFPRHVGQAEALAPHADVRRLVVLDCPAAVVAARIRRNSGGDRVGRTDDQPAAIAARIALFTRRTLPLLDHYRALGVRIDTVKVFDVTQPKQISLACPP